MPRGAHTDRRRTRARDRHSRTPHNATAEAESARPACDRARSQGPRAASSRSSSRAATHPPPAPPPAPLRTRPAPAAAHGGRCRRAYRVRPSRSDAIGIPRDICSAGSTPKITAVTTESARRKSSTLPSMPISLARGIERGALETSSLLPQYATASPSVLPIAVTTTALGEELASEPTSSRAERGAHRHLTGARGGPSEEQIRDVHAHDQQARVRRTPAAPAAPAAHHRRSPRSSPARGRHASRSVRDTPSRAAARSPRPRESRSRSSRRPPAVRRS